MDLIFMDCYKTIIDSLEDFEALLEPYFGEDAKLIEECEDSNQDTVEIYKYNPVVSDIEKYYFGDGTISNCWPGLINFGVSQK